MGFHSPAEALRVLGTAIEKTETARRFLALTLVRHGVPYPTEMPDISTKEAAQAFIGLDMEALRSDKEAFLETTVEEWDQKARERQGTLQEY